MKKKVIWVIVLALISAYSLLTWVQYQYYDRVLGLRQEGMRRQMKEALAEVADELQVRELVRYLNKGVGEENGYFTDVEFHKSKVARLDIWRRSKQDTLAVQRVLDSDQVLLQMKNKDRQGGRNTRVDFRPSDKLLYAYFARLHSLDRYILKYIYDVNTVDSIPQLVNIRLLKSLIRERFDDKDLEGPFILSLYDGRGQLIYEYHPEEMRRGNWKEVTTVKQHLFVPVDGTESGRPYMAVSLDLAPTRAEVLSLALPGLVSTILVLVLGFSALAFLLRDINFSEQRTSFINNMTHELKTPISSIILANKLLGEQASPAVTTPKQRQLLGIISTEAQRLKFLIDRVLQFSLLEGRAGSFTLEPLDVNELLLPVAEIYTFHAQQKGGDLSLDLEASETWVRASQVHLQNVFFNLLDNAVKYSRPDVALQLTIRTADEGDHIRITIEDNGLGIERKYLRKIFERFYRITSGNQHDVRGFGLGLAYVSSVIRQCGGRIQPESVVGVGTKMVILLPTVKEG